MHQDRGTSPYVQTVIPIYNISGDSNNLTFRSAYIQHFQGNPISTTPLHGTLCGRTYSIYDIYIITPLPFSQTL